MAEIEEYAVRDVARGQLIELLSAYSQHRWAAGWLSGVDEITHREGGVWEIIGRQIGWPLGYEADGGWVSWDDAEIHYSAKRRRFEEIRKA